MKLAKIYEKVKKYLLLLEEEKDIEKKKIKKLEEKIEEKIDKLKNKTKKNDKLEEKNRLTQELNILKEFKKQLKNKR